MGVVRLPPIASQLRMRVPLEINQAWGCAIFQFIHGEKSSWRWQVLGRASRTPNHTQTISAIIWLC